MSISATSTVKELAIEVPGATRVFEKLGIDYCCGGGRTLEAACTEAGIVAGEVVSQIEAAGLKEGSAREREWPQDSLGALVHFIIDKHHVFTTGEMARIEPLLAKVRTVHGHRHPELIEIERLFANLKADLTLHMKKEEMILFPYIIALEDAVEAGQKAPSPMFGTVRNPIKQMMTEHDTAGDILRNIRGLSGGFAVPADGCTSFTAAYEALEGLEKDLHQHIHLENNVLFPKTESMEPGA